MNDAEVFGSAILVMTAICVNGTMCKISFKILFFVLFWHLLFEATRIRRPVPVQNAISAVLSSVACLVCVHPCVAFQSDRRGLFPPHQCLVCLFGSG